MKIKVLGPGCKYCNKLHETSQIAANELGVNAEVGHITNIKDVIKYLFRTPVLMINENIVHQGKPLPDLEKVKALIQENVV